MKITIKTESLLNILLPLQPIINDNHIVPILQNVKLEFTKTKLFAVGNNLEVICSNSCKLANEKSITFCVNYTMILALVKSITDEKITITIDNNMINIIHSKGNFELPIESSKEFPKTETEKFTKKAHVIGTAFKSALKVANKFILNDDIDAMASISLSIGKKIFIRSTDRNRLFEEKIKGKGDAENILISGKSSLAIFALLENIEEDVEMEYNKNSIFFKFDNKEITVVQQQGDFPLVAFSKVLASIDKAELLKIDVPELITALKRVSIMSSREKFSKVKLEISKKNIIVSCESEFSSTKGEESIAAKFSKEQKVGYNYKYLIEILSVFDKAPDLYIDSVGRLYISQKKKTGGLAPIMLKD